MARRFVQGPLPADQLDQELEFRTGGRLTDASGQIIDTKTGRRAVPEYLQGVEARRFMGLDGFGQVSRLRYVDQATGQPITVWQNAPFSDKINRDIRRQVQGPSFSDRVAAGNQAVVDLWHDDIPAFAGGLGQSLGKTVGQAATGTTGGLLEGLLDNPTGVLVLAGAAMVALDQD